MKSMRELATGVSVLALAAVASFSSSATADQKLFYLYPHGAEPPNHTPRHYGPYEGPYVAPRKSKSGTWTDVKGALPFQGGPSAPMLMTDGTVLVLDFCAMPGQWYKLTPDSKGQYADGTWSAIAAMPKGYSPWGFAQQVLQDGRVLIEGGEWNDCNPAFTNQGALYDPVQNSWTSVSPPTGWSQIGDAESVILPNGTFMMADCCDSPGESATAAISGTTVTWTTQSTWTCDKGFRCANDEMAFNSLPGGLLETTDVWDLPNNLNQVWIWNNGTWTNAGTTPDLLSVNSDLGDEMGPAPLTWQGGKSGTLVQFGAATSTGYNDLYDIATQTWSRGPIMSVNGVIYNCPDAPAATLPDGNVFVQMSPGVQGDTPSHFWEVKIDAKGTAKAIQVNDPKTAPSLSSYEGNMLVVPTGQVLWTNSLGTPHEVALYTPKGTPNKSWLPVVSSVDTTLTVGSTGNAITGTNFNGFSSGGVFGDDVQAFTNWPIVRITNNASGDVCFARSYNFSTMGVWTTGSTNATFDIPSSCETGASTLQVIVNGVASKGTSVTLNS